MLMAVVTALDNDSGKVVAFSEFQASEVTPSNAMEKEGFKRCIKSLEDYWVKINKTSVYM